MDAPPVQPVMIDLKHHIASLVSVFLALAIGIFIGGSLEPGVQARIKTLIADQNTRIDNVLAEHNHDKVVVRNLESAMTKLSPALIAGKLTGKQIGQHIQMLTPDEVSSIREQLTSESVSADPLKDLLHPLVKSLAAGTTQFPDAENALQVLTREHLMDRSGDYSQPVNMVVLVGGYNVPPDDPNLPLNQTETELAQMLKERGVVVVGCEPETALTSSIASFQKADIATVDCIDHSMGRLDLIYALAGERGDYGWKATASRLLPPSIDGDQVSAHSGGRR